jgi:hypothetical protein
LPAAEQEIGGKEDAGEDGDSESACGGEVDAGEAEERGFEKRPDGKGGGRVEVAGDVPVAALKVADGSVAVPAFVGVLGPVHPGGVIGEVGVEMYGVEGEEEGGDEEEKGFDGVEDTRRDGVRVAHLLRGLNAGWRYEFQSITEVLLRGRSASDQGGPGLRSVSMREAV